MEWGWLRAGDEAAWAALLAEAEKVDATGEHYGAEDLVEELTDPMVDLERGTLAIRDGADLVAYGLLRSRPVADPRHSIYFEGTVHPRLRRTGLGLQIVDWGMKAAPEVHRPRYGDTALELMSSVDDKNTGARILLERSGFAAARYFFTMGRSLAAAVPPVRALPGIRIAAFDFAHDDATRIVRNEAFLDHWGSTPQTEQTWQQWFTGSRTFRPDLSFLAFDDETGDVVGILLGAHYEADTEATGIKEAFITTIGTRRTWRRRGIAGALIGTALLQAQRLGFERAGLDVDASSPTGALGLYESHGFAVSKKRTSFVRPIDL